MTEEKKQELFSYLSNEMGVIALQTQLFEIAEISSSEIREEIRAEINSETSAECERLKRENAELLEAIDQCSMFFRIDRNDIFNHNERMIYDYAISVIKKYKSNAEPKV